MSESTSDKQSIINENEESSSKSKEVNESDVYSLQDIIESEKEQDEIASAVLGASDAQNCSYDQGYVYRQALYCCITCLNINRSSINDLTQLHGICLACSYECHLNHELYELYTKRNFRCDCGNLKFNQKQTFKCKLKSAKDDLNQENKYNHNFNGLYCICDRPYPETDENINSSTCNDEMIQCTICEDWFHLKHLIGSELFNTSDENDYEEMICHKCMFNNQFLWFYQSQMALVNNKQSKLDTSELVDVETTTTTNNDECKLNSLKEKYDEIFRNKFENKELSCFLIDGWRDSLCKCETCINLYRLNKIDFLLKSNDSIKYYEDCGKRNDNTNEINETKLLNDELNKLNRVSQVEFLSNLNDFKHDLKEFLAKFARDGQVVKRENIEEFFDGLNERKRRRLDDFKLNGFYCK